MIGRSATTTNGDKRSGLGQWAMRGAAHGRGGGGGGGGGGGAPPGGGGPGGGGRLLASVSLGTRPGPARAGRALL
ncbi:hypothetical protein ACOSP7_024113 [Xanthoceras sorbifolium]